MSSISLHDPRWASLRNAYGEPYDASVSLRAIEAGHPKERYWDEFWSSLHHQGEVGDACYAVVAASVPSVRYRTEMDWNLFAFALTVEYARRSAGSPPVPDWISTAYHDAWHELPSLAIEALRVSSDPLVVRLALAVVATAKGLSVVGRLLSECDDSEIEEFHMQYSGKS